MGPTYITVPIELILAIVAATVVLFGWKSFKTPAWGVVAVLCVIPLQKAASNGGLLARFAVADVFTLLALAGTVVALIRGRAGNWRALRLPKQFVLGVGLFVPIVFASFFATETAERSFIETIAYLVNLVILLLVVFHVRTRDTLWRCLVAWEITTAVVVAGALVGAFFLFQGRVDTLLTNGPKVASTFKKSGQLSSYLMAGLPILWFNLMYCSPRRWQRVARRFLFAATMIALFATGSRTGFLLGGATAVALLGGPTIVALFRRRLLLKLTTMVFAAMVAIPVFGLIVEQLPFTFHRAFSIVYADEEGGGGSLQDLSPTRYYQMLGFRIAASEYPLTGVGVGDFYSRNTALVPGAWKPHEIHSTYLGVWAETGIFGIAALVLFYLGIGQALWQVIAHARDPRLAAAGVALLASSVVFWIYGSSHFSLRMRHMWAVFALGLAAWNVLSLERQGSDATGATA